MTTNSGVRIIGTCPALCSGMTGAQYITTVKEAGLEAEKQGWHSLLVYSDHRQIDPWIAAELLLANTRKISPLIAIQPLYLHPFSVARALYSLTFLHSRPVHLNFISGGFPRDLEAFCDTCPHDERYERIVEYATIIQKLVTETTPCTFNGRFYTVKSLQLVLAAPMPKHLPPAFTMSGSSPAGLAAAKKIGAIAIQYLKPSFSYNGVTLPSGSEYGARVGIIARETAELAWASAEKRYPESSDGTSIRNYYIKVSDSFWVKELGQTINVPEGHPYWLGPYKNNQAACPFLVGSRRNVASELAAYIAMGIRTFLIEKPENTEDADEISETFKMAQHLATITPTTPHVEISSANLSARPG